MHMSNRDTDSLVASLRFASQYRSDFFCTHVLLVVPWMPLVSVDQVFFFTQTSVSNARLSIVYIKHRQGDGGYLSCSMLIDFLPPAHVKQRHRFVSC